MQELKSVSQSLRKKKKRDNIVLLAKTMQNTIEVSISKAFIDLYISWPICFSE